MRRWLARFQIALLSSAVALLLCEAWLRLRPRHDHMDPLWAYHPLLGWTQTPNVRYRPATFEIAFNSLGFRDVERVREKPPNTFRIVCIGDSMLEAVQMPLEEMFPVLLEQQLNTLDRTRRHEVINLGVGDFGTAQEFLALHHYGILYQPDLVILQIFPLNDLMNNQIRYANQYGSENDRYRPYFVFHRGKLVQTSLQPIRGVLRRYLRAYRFFEGGYLLGLHELERQGYKKPWGQVIQDRNLANGWFDLGLYLHAQPSDCPPHSQEAWEITKALILRIKEEAESRQAAFFAIVVPWEIQVSPRRFQAFLDDHPEFYMVSEGRREPEQRLEAFFEQEGIRHLMLLPEFERHPETWNYIDGHLNETAHRLVSQLLLQALQAQGLIPGIRYQYGALLHPDRDL